jgi:hypothetical protein
VSQSLAIPSQYHHLCPACTQVDKETSQKSTCSSSYRRDDLIKLSSRRIAIAVGDQVDGAHEEDHSS